ncbi:hypothetical protein QEN19_002579 [Hanseniaspora menglaensis]
MSEVVPLINAAELEARFHKHNLSLPKTPILVSLWLGSFLAAIDNTVVANMMSSVANEFHQTDKQQYIATSFLLTNTAFQPLYGKLSDLIGRKKALMIALFFFWIGCIVTMFAHSVEQFALGRLICGMGAGGVNSLSSVIVSDICDARVRGIMQGYANLVYAAGQFLGAPIGGLIIDTIGWRYVFSLQVPLIIFCQILAWYNVNIKLAHVPKHDKYTWNHLKRLDIGGSFTLACSIGSFLIMSSEENLSQATKQLLIFFGVAFFALFVLTEAYWAPERLIPFEILSGRTGAVSLITVISAFVTFGDFFRKPLYLQLLQNFTSSDCGIFTVFTAFAGPAASFATGFITKHTSKNVEYVCYVLALFSMTLQLVAQILETILVSKLKPQLGLAQSDSTMKLFNSLGNDNFTWKVLLCLTTSASGYGYCTVLVSTLVVVVFTVEKAKQGTVIGLFYLWRSLGTVFGASLILTAFEKVLEKNLYNYLVLEMNDLKNYKKLIHDSSLIRKIYNNDQAVTEKLLSIYRQSFVISYLPQTSILVLGTIIAIALVYKMDKVLNKPQKDNKDNEIAA